MVFFAHVRKKEFPMAYSDWMIAAAGALAATAGVLVAWRVLEARSRNRSERVEAFLRQEKETGGGQGQRSAAQLMAKLGMTKGQVLGACRRSRGIVRLASESPPGADAADALMFEYARMGARV